MIDVQNLNVCVNKDGNKIKIIDDISFKINDGEILGLAGESGCGKSMTAYSIPNLLPRAVKISSGKIFFNGRDLTSLSEDEMRKIRGSGISMIFQDARSSLNPLIKAGDQITETLELGGSKDKEKNISAAHEILKSLGFNDPQKICASYPHQLSGGMCQRVMTAIAVLRDPELLLADEPSSSLDDDSQAKCLSALLERNKKNNMSLMIISHDLSIIRQFCSRFIIMYAGKILEEGPSGKNFSPVHPYTRALVNAIPHKDKRGSKLENIPGRIPTVEDRHPGCPFAPRCQKAKPVCGEVFPQAVIFYEERGTLNTKKVYCHFPEG